MRCIRAMTAAIVLLTVACGADPLPQVSPGNLLGIPFALQGTVHDTALRPVVGARVEVIDGPQAGATTTSGANGDFSFVTQQFTGSFSVRASKEGHATDTQAVATTTTQARVLFYLGSATPSAGLRGNYDLTFSAAAACTMLPPVAQRREYQVRLEPRQTPHDAYNGQSRPGAYVGTVSGGTFLERDQLSDLITSGAAYAFGDFVSFSHYDYFDYHDAVYEKVGPDSYVGISGRAEITLPSTIVDAVDVPWAGDFLYCERPSSLAAMSGCAVGPLRCASSNHVLTFRRH